MPHAIMPPWDLLGKKQGERVRVRVEFFSSILLPFRPTSSLKYYFSADTPFYPILQRPSPHTQHPFVATAST